MSYFDCIVCQGAFKRHQVTEITFGEIRAYVCEEDDLSQQEARAVPPPEFAPNAPEPEAHPVATKRASNFLSFFRKAA